MILALVLASSLSDTLDQLDKAQRNIAAACYQSGLQKGRVLADIEMLDAMHAKVPPIATRAAAQPIPEGCKP